MKGASLKLAEGGLVCLKYTDETLCRIFFVSLKHFELLIVCFELVSGSKINFDNSEMYELGEETNNFNFFGSDYEL